VVVIVKVKMEKEMIKMVKMKMTTMMISMMRHPSYQID